PAVAVAPVAGRFEAGVEQHRAEALDRVLARVLGVGPLAGGKAPTASRPGDGDVAARLEVHLDPRLRVVVEGDVLPLARHEVAADEAVEMEEGVAVEGGGDAEAVVVRRFEDRLRLDEIDADEQTPSRSAGADPAQE